MALGLKWGRLGLVEWNWLLFLFLALVVIGLCFAAWFDLVDTTLRIILEAFVIALENDQYGDCWWLD